MYIDSFSKYNRVTLDVRNMQRSQAFHKGYIKVFLRTCIIRNVCIYVLPGSMGIWLMWNYEMHTEKIIGTTLELRTIASIGSH